MIVYDDNIFLYTYNVYIMIWHLFVSFYIDELLMCYYFIFSLIRSSHNMLYTVCNICLIILHYITTKIKLKFWVLIISVTSILIKKFKWKELKITTRFLRRRCEYNLRFEFDVLKSPLNWRSLARYLAVHCKHYLEGCCHYSIRQVQ